MPSRKRRETLAGLFPTRSPAMRELLQVVGKVAAHDVPLLIIGESGSGKNYLAAAVHRLGERAAAPYVHIECASIPPDLFESELFGYEKGTFTDAQSRKLGKLEAAGEGTVYFDEIGALTPNLQAKLLRAIEERRFTRLGGGQDVPFRARVISSTALNIDELVATNDFRRDLLYRINVVTVRMPALRDRREDIPVLAAEFLNGRKIESDAVDILTRHSWPGNIRELRNVIERAALLEDSDSIRAAALPLEQVGGAKQLVSAAVHDHWTLEKLEDSYIREVLLQTRNNYSRAAEILGINRKTLLEKRRKYGID
ncbi:MAG: sigma 54-interacting transcriptional regulator [Thermoanaerobaculia bacterium]